MTKSPEISYPYWPDDERPTALEGGNHVAKASQLDCSGMHPAGQFRPSSMPPRSIDVSSVPPVSGEKIIENRGFATNWEYRPVYSRYDRLHYSAEDLRMINDDAIRLRQIDIQNVICQSILKLLERENLDIDCSQRNVEVYCPPLVERPIEKPLSSDLMCRTELVLKKYFPDIHERFRDKFDAKTDQMQFFESDDFKLIISCVRKKNTQLYEELSEAVNIYEPVQLCESGVLSKQAYDNVITYALQSVRAEILFALGVKFKSRILNGEQLTKNQGQFLEKMMNLKATSLASIYQPYSSPEDAGDVSELIAQEYRPPQVTLPDGFHFGSIDEGVRIEVDSGREFIQVPFSGSDEKNPDSDEFDLNEYRAQQPTIPEVPEARLAAVGYAVDSVDGKRPKIELPTRPGIPQAVRASQRPGKPE